MSRFSAHYLLFLFVYSESATIGKKVHVPNTDSTLQEFVYRNSVPNSNNQVRDSVWWIPASSDYHATKISVPSGGKIYSTYTFQTQLERSLCSIQTVAISSLKTCKPDKKSSQKLICHTTIAWTEGDRTSIEMENHCVKA